MNLPKLSKRLYTAASLARKGARVADIGTDHAYLPIYLYNAKIASGGVVSDINEGPVERAKANLRDFGCASAFAAQRADGLCGVLEHGVDDVFILGMGGELIANIIEGETRIKDGKYNLILQPMTHPELLRKYLFESGFEIIEERLVDEDKIYQIMLARYTGKCEDASEFELLFGKLNLRDRSAELCELMQRTKKVLTDRIRGKSVSGANADYENYVIEKIDEYLRG